MWRNLWKIWNKFWHITENLSLFEQSGIYHKQIKEFIDNNYYKLNYDENGNRTEKTELDIKSETLDAKISNKLKTQFQEYCKQNKIMKKQTKNIFKKLMEDNNIIYKNLKYFKNINSLYKIELLIFF